MVVEVIEIRRISGDTDEQAGILPGVVPGVNKLVVGHNVELYMEAAAATRGFVFISSEISQD